MDDSLSDLTARVVRFRDERNWEQFHSPRNLAAAIAVEAAELQEVLLWKTDSEIEQLARDPTFTDALRQEIADVLILSLLMARCLGIDPASAIREKLDVNAKRYPAEKARGRSAKYTELAKEDDT